MAKATEEKGYRIEYVPLDEIQRWPRNPKKHDEAGIDASLERHGFVDPMVMDEKTARLVSGHGRLEALQRRKAEGKEPPKNIATKGKEWMVPVLRGVAFKNEAEAEAYLIATNRLVERGGWDDAMVGDMLKGLGEVDAGLLGTGFSASEVADLLSGGRVGQQVGLALIADLKPHPRNYRSHPDDQLAHIVKSIEDHGFYRNIVVANDNTILAGHGVVLAAKKMGKDRVPIIRLTIGPDDPRALKVLTSDNEIRNLGSVDDRALTELLKDILGTEAGLLGTGFDEKQLAALTFITRPASEIGTIDEAKDWVGMPEYEATAEMHKLVVNLKSAEERDALVKLLGVGVFGRKDGNTWSCWWPPQAEKQDLASVKFTDGAAPAKKAEKATPDA